MNFRRKFLFYIFVITVFFSLKPSVARADKATDELFKKFLNYVAKIIIQYYASAWFQNTKKQMEDFSKTNQDNTIEQQNKFRENLARLADSANTVAKSQYDQQLKIETAPPPYICDAVQVTANAKQVEISRLGTDYQRGFASIDSRSASGANTATYSSKIKISPVAQFDSPETKGRFDFELLTETYGLRETGIVNQYLLAMSCIEKLMGPEPEYQSVGVKNVSYNTKNYQNEILSKVWNRNAVRLSLMSLVTKRKKYPISKPYPSEMDSIVKNYNVDEGLSLMESLAIQVDMYSAGSDFMQKVNNYAGLTPLTIIIAEMKAFENKLLHEITEAKEQILKLEAIDSLINLGAENER